MPHLVLHYARGHAILKRLKAERVLVMADMVCSALVEEALSRGVSFLLGKREAKASQSQEHIMAMEERLEMAASELELALERSAKLPITDVSLLQRRKIIKRAYVQAMDLLTKHKSAAVQEQAAVPQGVKRKRWFSWWANPKNNMSITPSAALNTDNLLKLERYARSAGRFLRYVEAGCSLHRYTFCNPIVRHLLQRKSLRYHSKQQGRSNQQQQLRNFCIWPLMYSDDERGVEAVLEYRYEDNIAAEKCFILVLILRLSESIDIVGVATTCLQLLTASSGLKLSAELAMGEITLLSTLQDTGHSFGHPRVGIQERYMEQARICRPDPVCCKEDRLGLCANGNNGVSLSLELTTCMFPEQVVYFGFRCYVSAVEPSSLTLLQLQLTVGFLPHDAIDADVLEKLENVEEYRDASIQQVAKRLKPDAVNYFLHRPELTKYEIGWYSKHGSAWFMVEKPTSMERRNTNTRPCTERR